MDDVAASTPNPFSQPGEHPRLDWHLDNWTIYTITGGLKHLRVKMPSWWSSGSNDFDKMVATMDARAAMAMDALIWERDERVDSFGRVHRNPRALTIGQRTAVLHIHINAAWRMNRLNIQTEYIAAREKLSDGLSRRHIP